MKIKIIFLTISQIFLFALNNTSSAKVQKDSLRISFDIINSSDQDTIMLEVFDHWWNKDSKVRYKTSKNDKGKFVFNIPTKKEIGFWQASIYDLKYDTLSGTKTYRDISIPFMWELGDNIECAIKNTPSVIGVNSTYTFEGLGKNKYILKTKLESQELIDRYQNDIALFPFTEKMIYTTEISQYNKYRIKLLKEFQNQISPSIHDAYLTDIIYPTGKSFYNTIRSVFNNRVKQISDNEKLRTKENYVNGMKFLDDSLFMTEGFLLSYKGIDYLFHRLKTIVYLGLDHNDPRAFYEYIVKYTEGGIRESLLSYYFRTTVLPKNADSLFNNSRVYFHSKTGSEEYKKIKEVLMGNKLFSNKYNLFDINQNPYTLDFGLFNDKIVLIDFYYTGCGPCKSLYQNTISKVKEYFSNNKNILFIAISIDRNYQYWINGIKNGDYSSISPNTINLFSGTSGMNHPIFSDNNIDGFPKIVMLTNKRLLYYNTENLKSEAELIKTINKELN